MKLTKLIPILTPAIIVAPMASCSCNSTKTIIVDKWDLDFTGNGRLLSDPLKLNTKNEYKIEFNLKDWPYGFNSELAIDFYEENDKTEPYTRVKEVKSFYFQYANGEKVDLVKGTWQQDDNDYFISHEDDDGTQYIGINKTDKVLSLDTQSKIVLTLIFEVVDVNVNYVIALGNQV